VNLWIITDTHFGNDQFVEGNLRPKDFGERIMKGLGHCPLKPDSVLVHLGDVCMDDDADWNSLLTNSVSGRKWLVIGNHDHKSAQWYLSHGWDWVGDSFSLAEFGKRILFTHKPEILPVGYGLNVHGHFHDFSQEKIKQEEPDLFKLQDKRHFLVSMERLHYQPISLKRVVEIVNKEA